MYSNVIMKVYRLHKDAKLPTRKHRTDAGLDLYAVQGGTVPARGKAKIPTGIAIQLVGNDENAASTLCLQIISRSGLSANHSIEKGAGLIDYDYRGEINVILYNHSDKDYLYFAGDRIAQAVVLPVILPEIVEVDSLEVTERGSGGFGSSGQ